MMPRVLSEVGLAAAIHDLLEKTLTPTGLQHHFDTVGTDRRLPETIELSLYRIAQELINNIIKHAQATEVHVQLLQQRTQALLIVEDNGLGFDLTRASSGLGLLNVQSRASTVQGEVQWEQRTGGGTSVIVRVPIPT
jgi:signal transduction histidine kinase